MKREVKVPSVGESIASGVIVTWLKQNGESVKEGENLFELETDKAVLEVPSPAAGVLEILAIEGTEVAIGQTVAMLDSEATGQATAPPPTGTPSVAPAPAVPSEPVPVPAPPPVAENAEAPPVVEGKKAVGPPPAPIPPCRLRYIRPAENFPPAYN